MAAHGAPIDINYESEFLERHTANVQAACDRKAYTEALDQLMEAHKHLVRLNDLHPDSRTQAMTRRLRKAQDAYFLALCRVSTKLGSAK
jgi:hypothetical protein